MAKANTLAYHDTATVTIMRSFIVHAPGGRKWQLIYPNLVFGCVCWGRVSLNGPQMRWKIDLFNRMCKWTFLVIE